MLPLRNLLITEVMESTLCRSATTFPLSCAQNQKQRSPLSALQEPRSSKSFQLHFYHWCWNNTQNSLADTAFPPLCLGSQTACRQKASQLTWPKQTQNTLCPGTPNCPHLSGHSWTHFQEAGHSDGMLIKAKNQDLSLWKSPTDPSTACSQMWCKSGIFKNTFAI